MKNTPNLNVVSAGGRDGVRTILDAVAYPAGVFVDSLSQRSWNANAEEGVEAGRESSRRVVLGDVGLAPGTPLTELIAVSEEVLELDLNPNRSDCRVPSALLRRCR